MFFKLALLGQLQKALFMPDAQFEIWSESRSAGQILRVTLPLGGILMTVTADRKYKRILLKLSGEQLMGSEGFGH